MDLFLPSTEVDVFLAAGFFSAGALEAGFFSAEDIICIVSCWFVYRRISKNQTRIRETLRYEKDINRKITLTQNYTPII